MYININHGNLICEAPKREYITDKVVGVIFTVIFLISISIIVILIIKDFILYRNMPFIHLLFYILLCITTITVMEIIFLPMAFSQRFRIYKNGIIPHKKPFTYWLKRREYFIPFNELNNIIITKTTDGAKCFILYPKNWRRIVVEYSNTGDIVFNELLKISRKFQKNTSKINK